MGKPKVTVQIRRDDILPMAAQIASGLARLDQSRSHADLDEVDEHIAARAVNIAVFIVARVDQQTKGGR